MDGTPALTAAQPLIDAGKTLATLADPNDDLIDLSGGISEIAMSLDWIVKGLERAHDDQTELAATKHEWRAIDRKARTDAARAAKRALVELAAWIGAVETSVAEQDREAA